MKVELVFIPRRATMRQDPQTIDRILQKHPWPLTAEDQKRLLKFTRDLPLFKTSGAAISTLSNLQTVLGKWNSYIGWLSSQNNYASLDIYSPAALWAFPFALSSLISAENGSVFAISGPAGAGKSTLTGLLVDCLNVIAPFHRYVRVSLDDFYFPRAERLRRGLAWRAQPGTHDINAAVDFLEKARSGLGEGELPRFSHAKDDRDFIEKVSCVNLRVIFDGWFLGMRSHGYDRIADLIDLNCFLDCPLALAKTRRFAREERLRKVDASQGFSANDLSTFWDTVLEPGIHSWVNPIKGHADLIIELDGNGEVVGARRMT